MGQLLYVCHVVGTQIEKRSEGLYSTCKRRTFCEIYPIIVLCLWRLFSWDDNDAPAAHPIPLRGEQLAFRHHEIYIAYSTICRLLQNDPALDLDIIDNASFDKRSWIARNEEEQAIIRYDDRVVLTGHSFGGCTMVRFFLFLLDSFSPSHGHLSFPCFPQNPLKAILRYQLNELSF